MKLKELLELQKELDDRIIEKKYNPSDMGQLNYLHEMMLPERLLALQVETSELANATRCFKYWSDKGPEPKERILDEYADVLHFVLSVGNTLNFTAEEIEEAYIKKHKENYKRLEEGY
ncbi:dUTPase [Gottschalkia purinilytica]|uniref:dUTPase n=1 Tax=Gottschalkia purinilytica TaxID=1503 RepID=A0A0L0W623_GOTPU|nr:dUTPase [Gottschalkia purinilytica]KNF06942.1 dUTPase [Gottschalkia purinilytica]